MQSTSSGPDDNFLISRVLVGDAAALGRLIDRYDRLVRFTIFQASKDRCLRDPQWLESVASTTWDGFIRSMRRAGGDAPGSLKAYITRIARNQVVDAIRSEAKGVETQSLDTTEAEPEVPVQLDDPSATLSQIESLEALSSCLEELPDADRTLATQLEAITERRWRDAAEALGMKESTLRSRWKQVLGRLRTCMERKSGETLAPGGLGLD